MVDAAPISLHRQFNEFYDRYRDLGQQPPFLGRMSNLLSCAEFLDIIVQRYRVAALEHHAAVTGWHSSLRLGKNVLTQEQQNLLETMNRTNPLIHLEIQSFYLFAKILLDRWSQFIEFWFGSARAASLTSHDKLTKNIGTFTAAHRLPPLPPDLESAMHGVKRKISDYRDYQICHDRTPAAYRGTLGHMKNSLRTAHRLRVERISGQRAAYGYFPEALRIRCAVACVRRQQCQPVEVGATSGFLMTTQGAVGR